MTKTFNVPSRCPYCEAVHDCATIFAEKNTEPKDGDVSCCLDCALVSVWDQGKLRTINDDEVRRVLTDPFVQDVQRAVRKIINKKKRRRRT